MSRLNADILLFLTAGIWGVALLFQKSATVHVRPVTFLAMRGLIAALALALREGRRAAAPVRSESYLISCLGGAAVLIAGWLQQAELETATVTNTGLPHSALRGHHAAHCLVLERQVAQPAGVAGRARVCARYQAAGRRHARRLPNGGFDGAASASRYRRRGRRRQGH